jgi:phage tail sheath protein FI
MADLNYSPEPVKLAPGVYFVDEYPQAERAFRTGRPVFFGITQKAEPFHPVALTRWQQMERAFGAPVGQGWLHAAVRGFFENGGELCYVAALGHGELLSLDQALDASLIAEDADLVCAPDLMNAPGDAVRLQQQILEHCDRNERFAVLDPLPGVELCDVVVRQWRELTGFNAALYYPWVTVRGKAVPPCGHVAGVIARTDREDGVQQAPANRVIEGVYDVQPELDAKQQVEQDPDLVVNCIRAFPGRGIRVWGARTVSGLDPWRYVNVRRMFLTLGRWLQAFLADAVFEPNDRVLWGRIRRDVDAYLYKLYRGGALAGDSPEQAYFIRCGPETTSGDDRMAGRVVAEIGVAPVTPNEFVMVRLTRGADEHQNRGGENPAA